MLSINFKSLFGGLKARPGRRSTDDWGVFLIIITCLFIILVVYHGWLFFSIEHESASNVVSNGKTIDTIDRDALDKTIEYLNRRVEGINVPIQSGPLPSTGE